MEHYKAWSEEKLKNHRKRLERTIKIYEDEGDSNTSLINQMQDNIKHIDEILIKKNTK